MVHTNQVTNEEFGKKMQVEYSLNYSLGLRKPGGFRLRSAEDRPLWKSALRGDLCLVVGVPADNGDDTDF